jgi:flagellar basal-body rod protein FlgB
MFLKDALFARTSINTVAKSLDACALRGRAIAANLANATTPGYQRIEVGESRAAEWGYDCRAW